MLGCPRDDFSDVASDLIPERVFNRFEAGACEYPNPPTVPFVGRKAVEMNMVRVAEAIQAIFLDLPEKAGRPVAASSLNSVNGPPSGANRLEF